MVHLSFHCVPVSSPRAWTPHLSWLVDGTTTHNHIQRADMHRASVHLPHTPLSRPSRILTFPPIHLTCPPSPFTLFRAACTSWRRSSPLVVHVRSRLVHTCNPRGTLPTQRPRRPCYRVGTSWSHARRVRRVRGDGGFRRRQDRRERTHVRVGEMASRRRRVPSHLEGHGAMWCVFDARRVDGVETRETLQLRRLATAAQRTVRGRLRTPSWDAWHATGARMRGCVRGTPRASGHVLPPLKLLGRCTLGCSLANTCALSSTWMWTNNSDAAQTAGHVGLRTWMASGAAPRQPSTIDMDRARMRGQVQESGGRNHVALQLPRCPLDHQPLRR